MKLTKKQKKLVLLLLIFCVISIYNLAIQKPTPTSTTQPTQSPLLYDRAKVVRVIDGDTIEIENGVKVRYIGIDTPELHHPKKSVQCFGKEAFEENKKLVEGKEIRLEKDVSETDKYKRLLRYIYVDPPAGGESSPSGILLNDYLVRQGFAHSSTFPPDVKYQEQFVEAEKEARAQKRGLWKSCAILLP